MKQIINDPSFGLILTIFIFYFSIIVVKHFNMKIINPLVMTLISIICILYFAKIPYESYYNGGKLLDLLITPATVALALPLYRSLHILKKHFVMILFVIITTTFICSFILVIMGYYMHIDKVLIATMLPKTVTTAIAIEVSKEMGGILSITVISVVITGNIGMIFGPSILKLCRIEHPVAKGISLGLSSHAMGTVRSIELGEVEGAMSGVALSITGVVIIFVAPIVYYTYNLFI